MSDNIFNAEIGSHNDSLIPIIYYPAVDALDNFIREVHCYEKPIDADGVYEVEVTIIFNNKVLRKHAAARLLDLNYRKYRRYKYGRMYDIESFKVLVWGTGLTNWTY